MIPFLLHHTLANGVTIAPDKVAVVAPNGSLTFSELDQASNRLANLLLGQGIAKGDRVGIDLEKGVEAVIAIFAILKTGAAYVPLDPKTPFRRKALVIADCEMHGLITSLDKLESLRTVLAVLPSCLVLTARAATAGTHCWNDVMSMSPAVPADPAMIELDLAYILYTSGSTGVPKGVMISHRAALTFVNWATGYFQLESTDRLANHAPLHFDLSIFDIFASVAVGGTMVLLPPTIAIFPRSLAKWIDEMQITVWYSVPSALTQLVLHGGLEKFRFAALRRILFAGEVFQITHLRRLMDLIAHASFFNLYGPTETNVCMVYAVPRELPADQASLPIGKACANTEVFAVDSQGQSPATGEAGELLVRGTTLMRGYWGQPIKSAEVLVGHARVQDPTERAYRTGDLVRKEGCGNYFFIGRRDSQVKSRGYRIELGDVEAVLHQHPAVAMAAVIPIPHPEFGCVLRGVLVLGDGCKAQAGEIATFCSDALPSYMIPADFDFRTALPMTANGKIDRRTLLEETTSV